MADTIDVYLFGKLRQFGPEVPLAADCVVQVSVQPADTISDVLARLGIDLAQVAHMFLNYQYSSSKRRVEAGDRLGVFGRDMALLYRQYFAKQE